MRPENNYPQYMRERILPYILPRRKERYLSREPGRKIYCAFYTADFSANQIPPQSNSTEHQPFCDFADVQMNRASAAESNRKASDHSGTAKGILLISHGFTETADKYFEIIYYFLKAGYHVCVPEHCGHGRSYRLAEGDLCLVHTDSWERYAEDLSFIAFSAKEYWPEALPLFLFAHSMGGGIGAALSALEPALFNRVILSSPMIRPSTGPVPWLLTKQIVAAMCALGREQEYVIGQHAYDGKETFEASFATSPARHAWYKEKTDAEPRFQTSGASYGWLREAIRLNRFLMEKAWKQITVPVLLVQAENETVVSKKQQELFIRMLARSARSSEAERKKLFSAALPSLPQEIRFVCVPGAKHEIYRSDDPTLVNFMKGCLDFLTLS